MTKFFDIYSSPIVRSFFSNLVDTSCEVTLPKFVEFELKLGKKLTRYENISGLVCYETEVDGYAVKFQFCDNPEQTDVEFFVSNGYERHNLPKRTKIAITRWLLAVWNVEKDNHTKFACSPCGGVGGFRGDYYSRFGFTWIDDTTMTLVK